MTRDEVIKELEEVPLVDLGELIGFKCDMGKAKKFFLCGQFDEEYYLVEAIEMYLLTEEQRKRMFDANLTIEKILNGRFVSSDVGNVVQNILDEWNAKLGWKHFGF